MKRTTTWSEANCAIPEKKALCACCCKCFCVVFLKRMFLSRFFFHQVLSPGSLFKESLSIKVISYHISQGFSLTRFSHQVPFARNLCLYRLSSHKVFLSQGFSQGLSQGFSKEHHMEKMIYIYIYTYRVKNVKKTHKP